MARLPISGQDSGTWGDILNEYLLVSHAADGTLTNDALVKAGSVTSVNSKSPVSGNVTLAASDVSALPDTAGLSDLADVNATSPSDDQVLAYDNGSRAWVASTITSSTVTDATDSSKGIVQLTGDLGGTAASPTVTATSLTSALPVNQGGTGSITKSFVDLTAAQTVGGVKTFTSAPVVPSGSFPESAVTSLTSDLAATEKAVNKGAASGYAPLDGDSLVPIANLPYNITVSDSAPSNPQDGTLWFDTSAS